MLVGRIILLGGNNLLLITLTTLGELELLEAANFSIEGDKYFILLSDGSLRSGWAREISSVFVEYEGKE